MSAQRRQQRVRMGGDDDLHAAGRFHEEFAKQRDGVGVHPELRFFDAQQK